LNKQKRAGDRVLQMKTGKSARHRKRRVIQIRGEEEKNGKMKSKEGEAKTWFSHSDGIPVSCACRREEEI